MAGTIAVWGITVYYDVKKNVDLVVLVMHNDDMTNHQTPIPIKLTTDETIARIDRLDQAYACSIDMLDARTLLTFPFEWDQPYHPPINTENLWDYYDDYIDQDFPNMTPDMTEIAQTMLDLLITLPLHAISQMRLDRSLCPIHACDYQSCFDDDDAECNQIRTAFPSHDT